MKVVVVVVVVVVVLRKVQILALRAQERRKLVVAVHFLHTHFSFVLVSLALHPFILSPCAFFFLSDDGTDLRDS